MPGMSRKPLAPETLRDILEGTASETGREFFDLLTKHLARAMNTKCAWVTEWSPEERRLKALSFWVGDGYYGDYEYDISDTPCEPVITGCEFIHFPDRILDLFPNDPDLAPLGVVSYMGVPLLDTDDRILGHLAVMHEDPLPADADKESIFKIFAGRAAAELRRVRRDRALREREQKLSALIDNTMDAVIELDHAFHVTRSNPGAEKLFAQTAEELQGKSLQELFTPSSCGRLSYLMVELERKPKGRQSLWVPEGIVGLRDPGGEFPAEATLSRFEVDSRPFHTLILRDVDQKREAEEQIRALMDEAAYLRDQIEALQGFDDMIGESPALRAVLEDVDKVARTDATVLITGETGTGKELLAHSIHKRSSRSDKPLVTVNCAAIAENLQESEFFGHEAGAFTGASGRREGRFKLAHEGTIFLDEVGELPPDLQAKLLRVLQEGEFEPVGGSRTEQVDVRVIVATNRDLDAMVREGTFRRDLLYRLNVFPLCSPPLRERGRDVLLLARAFITRFAPQSSGMTLTEQDEDRLLAYDWPGNIRELRNVMERAVIAGDGRRLNLARALPDSGAQMDGSEQVPASPGRILTEVEMRRLERDNLCAALEACAWRVSGDNGAAARLGLKPSTLASRMKALGIRKPND
jgi:PAS domain S-box-containing protein